MSKKTQCPCCGYYTFPSYEEALFESCPVCKWQFDDVCHNPPDQISGANGIRLKEARENYKQYGIAVIDLLNRTSTRAPKKEELP